MKKLCFPCNLNSTGATLTNSSSASTFGNSPTSTKNGGFPKTKNPSISKTKQISTLSKSESKESNLSSEKKVEEQVVLKGVNLDELEENVKTVHVETQNVETQNLETQNVENQIAETQNVPIQDVEIQEMPEEISAQLPTSFIRNDNTCSSFQNKLDCELDFENEPNESISPITETAGMEPATEDMLTHTISQSGVPQSFSQMTFEELETMKNDVLDPVSNQNFEQVGEREILKEEDLEENGTDQLKWQEYEPWVSRCSASELGSGGMSCDNGHSSTQNSTRGVTHNTICNTAKNAKIAKNNTKKHKI